MTGESLHDTVLLQQAIKSLIVDRDGAYFDCTYGRGGHSRGILEQLGRHGRLIAIDQDPEALASAASLEKLDSRFSATQGNFNKLSEIAGHYNVSGQASGVIYDLGVSSPQLDNPTRGFSFMHDGPLDMRMDPQSGQSASTWINHARETEIATVLKEYGEERFARRMARAIVQAREEQPITRTARLAEIVKQANPAWERDKHPATRSFQAIRIFINRELDVLSQSLNQALDVMRVGGHLVVISFHSLEDKIVKKFITLQTKGDNFPRGVPVTQKELNPRLKAIGKAVRADPAEIMRNPRSRSAIMRVAEKIA